MPRSNDQELSIWWTTETTKITNDALCNTFPTFMINEFRQTDISHRSLESKSFVIDVCIWKGVQEINIPLAASGSSRVHSI